MRRVARLAADGFDLSRAGPREAAVEHSGFGDQAEWVRRELQHAAHDLRVGSTRRGGLHRRDHRGASQAIIGALAIELLEGLVAARDTTRERGMRLRAIVPLRTLASRVASGDKALMRLVSSQAVHRAARSERGASRSARSARRDGTGRKWRFAKRPPDRAICITDALLSCSLLRCWPFRRWPWTRERSS